MNADAATDSGEATQLLATLFKTLATNWGKIDTLVEMVRISQPNFYNEYVKVSKIIETGSGSLALKIQATNALTGEPEANVTVTLTPTNGQLKTAVANGKKPIVKKTAKGGGAHEKNMLDGTYSYSAKKTGRKEVNGAVDIVNGEMTVLEIKMEKS